MGRTKGPYSAEHPAGTRVLVADREQLERFMLVWNQHHPMMPGQLAFAGREAEVANVSFYHGGDEIYELRGVPRHLARAVSSSG